MARPVRVSIVTSGHDVADARLHREVAALLRAGGDVEVLGLGDAAQGPPGATVRTWRRGSLVGRAWLALRLPWLASGDVLLTLDPDSALGAALWRRLPRRSARRHAADVHEDYALLLRDRAWAHGAAGRVAVALVRAFERAAGRADLTVVADENLALGAPRRVVLRNTPDARMLPEVSAPDLAPRLLYVGDLRESRGLDMMLETLRAAPQWSLDLVGPLRGEALARFQATLAADRSLAARVRWHGRQEPRLAWTHAAGVWAGLAFLADTPAFRRAMPSKLYEYLACGLPVLTTGLPRPAALVRDSGAGVVVADSAAAAAQLQRWLDEPASYDAMRQRAIAAGARLRSGDELDAFAQAVVGLVAARPGSPLRTRMRA